ncbi:MAG: OsmC family protein [Pseudomonadota bacterium]
MEKEFSVSMELVDNYKFLVDFGSYGELVSDEPEPLGEGQGPNPSRILAASVANCLAASLMFALRKFKDEPGKVSAEVKGHLDRVDGRWRIVSMDVDIKLGNASATLSHLERALEQFEDFCVVTQSVRNGIDVNVKVEDSDGKLVKG